MGQALHLLSPKGFRAGASYAAIRAKRAPDVGLLVCDAPATAAAVFTTNKVVAAPVKVGREHVLGGRLRAIVVNAGNANACTGLHGELDARHMCATAAEALGCDPREVLPASTGIIGHMLPMPKLEKGIRAAARALGSTAKHANQFADSILTTDTRRKTAGVELRLGRQVVRIAGVAKGAGMIGPRLAPHSDALDALNLPHADLGAGAGAGADAHATMLAFLTTDAKLPPAMLRKLLSRAADGSFNAVTIDDHASTNDTAAVLASGASGATVASHSDLRSFSSALNDVCRSLAYQIAADGEGATKVVTITVSHAPGEAVARAIARTIANSPLVKAAIHGNDPNWGRIVSAAGYAGVPFDPERATLALQGKIVFRHGQPVAFDAKPLSRLLARREVLVQLSCGNGKSCATCWTCDLSEDYVSINADYHT
jgi:glutamate N-acetyltransferase/amino-acid N-acetyltransferase